MSDLTNEKTELNGHQGGAAKVLVVALPVSAWGLSRMIDNHAYALCCVGVASTAAQAVQMLQTLPQSTPDVVLFDLDGENGAEGLTDVHAQSPARILALTSTTNTAVHDAAILAGARGVMTKHESPETLLKALAKVHAGEMWIDRSATGRIFMELARQRVQSRLEDPAQEKFKLLTPREQHTMLALAADAASPAKVLAHRLHISEHTLRNHLTSIYSKLGVSNRTELYAFSHKHGLVPEA